MENGQAALASALGIAVALVEGFGIWLLTKFFFNGIARTGFYWGLLAGGVLVASVFSSALAARRRRRVQRWHQRRS